MKHKMGDTYNTTNNNQKLSINIFLNKNVKMLYLLIFVDNIRVSLKFTIQTWLYQIYLLNDIDVTERLFSC